MRRRPRKRYVALRLDVSNISKQREIIDIVYQNIQLPLLTQQAWSMPKLVMFDASRSIGIFRCDQKTAEKIRQILSKRSGEGSTVETLKTSGTIKRLRETLRLCKETNSLSAKRF